MTNKKPTSRPFPPERVGPKLRRHALLRAWEEIEAEAKRDFVKFSEEVIAKMLVEQDPLG